jgi:hypothetical protein
MSGILPFIFIVDGFFNWYIVYSLLLYKFTTIVFILSTTNAHLDYFNEKCAYKLYPDTHEQNLL